MSKSDASRSDCADGGRAITSTRHVGAILTGLFLAAVIGFSIAPLVNELRKIHHGEDGTKDYPLWYDTAQREMHGISPYYLDRNGEFPFMYPPGAAVLLAPLALMGRVPMVLMLVLINSIAWGTCILAPVYLVSGRIRGLPHAMYWLPSVICCVFIWDTYLEGQCAFGLSACLLGMLVCLNQKRKVSAGLLLALAAAFKGFPILALPYLIYRRQWNAIASTVVSLAVLLFVFPACLRGPHGAIEDLRSWRDGMLSTNTESKMTATGRGERSYTWQNGSVLAVAHRWLRHVKGDTDRDAHDQPLPPMYVNVADLPLKTVNHIADAAIVLLGTFYIAVMPHGSNRTNFTSAAEGAMLLILIILVSPMSFTYNTSWLMLGITVVLYYIVYRSDSNRRSGIAVVWLLIALAPLIFSVSTRDPNWRYLRAIGNTFFSEMILLAELAWILLTQRAKPTLPNRGF